MTERRDIPRIPFRRTRAALLVFGLAWSGVAAANAGTDFQKEIAPILAEHCLKCHGRDKPKAGLDLTTRDSAVKVLKSGAVAIVPGQPHQSAMLNRLTSTHPDEQMPPPEQPKRPAAEQIAKLRAWIAGGAAWAPHWAYAPVQRPSVPPVKEAGQIRNAVDAFIVARLESQGLAPSPQADRSTLIKRVCYDLTGLPPTPEEVDAFIADASPDAFEKLVDRAMASSHFGERWGRHWLDLARYADSDGYEKDSARPDAWRYRDWVIDAFNRDMPFDQFTIEQLAGDLLPNATPEQKLATAFHRQTLTNREGGVDQEQFRVEATFDRTETTGGVWMGLTVGCARCHSHKYDQISHQSADDANKDPKACKDAAGNNFPAGTPIRMDSRKEQIDSERKAHKIETACWKAILDKCAVKGQKELSNKCCKQASRNWDKSMKMEQYYNNLEKASLTWGNGQKPPVPLDQMKPVQVPGS